MPDARLRLYAATQERRQVRCDASTSNVLVTAQARVVISDWKADYNHRRPHPLGYQAPAVTLTPAPIQIDSHDAALTSHASGPVAV